MIPSASLIPKEDPTVLFTTAGMHPLVPYLLGQPHPAGKRLVNVQKCVRTVDIDQVGDNTHNTFFEMLGNWSLGDYWKKESIEWSWEFLTSKDYLGIEPKRLYITVFEGHEKIPRDNESIEIWSDMFFSVGMDPKIGERIFLMGKEDNFWGPAGNTGPCGPDTEIFYDTYKDPCSAKCKPGCGCGKYFEIWNNVFMEYNLNSAGECEELKQKNVDTGMGVERTIAILGGRQSVFETDVFAPLMEIISKSSNEKDCRIIADHIKASCFILADGIRPSNKEQGYVLRRLLRKSFVIAQKLNLPQIVFDQLVAEIKNIYEDAYPEIEEMENIIRDEISREAQRFKKTLGVGLKMIEKHFDKGQISANQAFELYATYGFPIEVTKSLAEEKGVRVDIEGYKNEYQKHREISRKGIKGIYRGGLADHSQMSTKYHTATHLLLAALRELLGEGVIQKGSNITPERLRLDFEYPAKLTADQIKKVEDMVNQKINDDMDVEYEEVPVSEAFSKGVLGVFGERYGEVVRVYSIGDFSKEICGGPHVEKTGVLGKFKIMKEEAVSQGVRRIKATLA